MGTYVNLFSPLQIGQVTVKNRIVMGPMDGNMINNDGTLSHQAFSYYLERAKGGVGMIITEAAALEWPMHKGGKRQPRFNSRTISTEWWALNHSVHAFGVKTLAQINHKGYSANGRDNDSVDNVTASTKGQYTKNAAARELTVEELQDYIEKYVFCSEMVEAAGFDGIELHAASGSLLCQFLSPLTNARTDRYGGSVENRVRFLTEIVAAIRKARGNHFIISVRLAMQDYPEGGLNLDDTAAMAALLEHAGADMINCCVGFTDKQEQGYPASYSSYGQMLDYARACKKR